MNLEPINPTQGWLVSSKIRHGFCHAHVASKLAADDELHTPSGRAELSLMTRSRRGSMPSHKPASTCYTSPIGTRCHHPRPSIAPFPVDRGSPTDGTSVGRRQCDLQALAQEVALWKPSLIRSGLPSGRHMLLSPVSVRQSGTGAQAPRLILPDAAQTALHV
jgi:hypothetical protein